MPGRGPAPKNPEQRRRANKQPEFEELPVEGYQGEVPPLGEGYRSPLVDDEGEEASGLVSFLPETREWYAEWSRSPMATKFTATDWTRLRRVIAPLFDKFIAHPTKDLAAELRLQEERLGGTIMDRQRMRQRIGEVAAPTRKRASKASSSRRARLRAVS